MNIGDRDSLQENPEATIAGNGAAEDSGAEIAGNDLDDVAGGSGYAFLSKCANCGEPLRGHVKKCPKCGYKLPHSI